VIIPEHSPRPVKGGDTTIHGQSTEKIQVVQDSIFEGGESGDTVERRLTYCQSRDTDDNEGPQELNQSSAPEGNEQQGAIKECTPVALRTRSCRQQESSTRNNSGKGEFGQDTNRSEDKELIRRLTTQNKEQQNTIEELSSAVKEFLRVQSTVKKLQGNIEKLSKQLESHEKFKVPLSTNHQIVKPFTPKNSVDVLHRQTHAENQTSVLKTRGQQLDAECELRCQGSEIEACTSEIKTRRRKTRADTKKQLKPMDTQELSDRLKSMLNPWQIRGMEILQSQVDHQAEALRKHRNASREFMDKLDHEERTEYYVDSDDEVVMYNKRPQHTLNDSYYDSDSPEEQPRKEKIQHTAFVATPKRQSKATSIGSSDSHKHADSVLTDIYNIDHWEAAYMAAGIPEKFLRTKKEMERRKAQDERLEQKAFMLEEPKSDTSGSVYEDAETEQESESLSPQNAYLKQSVSKPQRYKREPFVAPKYPKEDRAEANARVSAALDQVNPSVHLNPQGKRNTATLYVGNLEFNTSEQDLRKSLDRFFKRIKVEKITIPKVQGRSKYGFIEISWAHRALVKTIDLCIMYSGMIQVNSRPIYLRELRGNGGKK
jgi:hypothetical protein